MDGRTGARTLMGPLLFVLMLALGGYAVTMPAHRLPVAGASEAHVDRTDGDHGDLGGLPLRMALGSCFAILAAAVGFSLRKAHLGLPALRLTRIPSGLRLLEPVASGRPPPRVGTVLRP